MSTIFTKIINRELPATIEYEDEEFIAIRDIKPQAPIDVLVILKKPVPTLEDLDITDDQTRAKFLQTARKVAKLLGIEENYRLKINVGRKIQLIHHLHAHVQGGWDNAEKEA